MQVFSQGIAAKPDADTWAAPRPATELETIPQRTNQEKPCDQFGRFKISACKSFSHTIKVTASNTLGSIASRGDAFMMIDWNEYHRQFGARVGELAKLSPDTVKGYQTLSAANSATTKLGEKTRQLISLAVAITTKCDGCIVHHTDAALKAGATKEEIAEALGVAVGMNAGAALVYSTRVLDAVEAKSAAAAR
jgi:AhpD family alkylhydroperoxidase